MQNLRFPPLKRLALVIFIIAPLAAWSLVKPIRVVAPGLGGATCISASICTDDPAKARQAEMLYAEAIAFVSKTVSPLRGQPKIVFCSTQACADAFGLGARSAVTVGTIGTVIGPRAWHDYYVRHELIHYLQAERCGTLALSLKPSWFVEGMAYAMSQDPRTPLSEPFESERSQFRSWYETIDKAALWLAAEQL